MTDFLLPAGIAEYGVLGLWTGFNIYLINRANRREDELQEKLLSVINQNTAALTSTAEVMRSCPKKN